MIATISLLNGDFPRGWDAYEWRRKSLRFPDTRNCFTQSQWTGAEDLAGKTILLRCEQGLGDSIQFIRYAPLLAQRGATVLLHCFEPLVTLMKRVDGIHHVIPIHGKPPRFDYQLHLMSLPHAFQTTL